MTDAMREMIEKDQECFQRRQAAQAKLAEAITEIVQANYDQYQLRNGLVQDKTSNIRMASDDARAMVKEMLDNTVTNWQYEAMYGTE